MPQQQKQIKVNLNTKSLKTLRNQLDKYILSIANLIDGRTFNKIRNDFQSKQRKTIIPIYKSIKYLINNPEARNNKKLTSKIIKDDIKIVKENANKRIAVYGDFKYFTPTKKLIKQTNEPIDVISYQELRNQGIRNIQEFIDREYLQAYNESQDYYSRNLKKLIKVSYRISSVAETQNLTFAKLPMRNAFVLNYNWLKYAEGISKKSFEDMKGRCVYELLIEHLKPTWKTISKDDLFKIFKQKCHTMPGSSDLDFGLDCFNEFTINSGVNSEMIMHLCELKNIPMYAYDADEKLFMKRTGNHSNYKPIAYYNINGHMYLITNSEMIKSMSEREKTNKTILNSSLLSDAIEESKYKHEQKQDDDNFKSCETFDDAIKHQNKHIFINSLDMTQNVIEYIIKNKSVPIIGSNSKHKITGIHIKEKNLSIYCDLNQVDGLRWEHIKNICDEVNIPFKNQSIGTLIKQLEEQFFKESTPENESIADSQEIVKYNLTSSTFNSNVEKIIINNRLSKHWAFVDKVDDVSKYSSDSIHKIDHIKCRRNLVMYNQYDFPIFSVMDEPTIYNNESIKPGYYYIECDNYFPLRGNGWYAHPLIIYSLEQNIISKNQIKYQLLSSFTLPKNYYQKFAQYLIDIVSKIDLKVAKLIINAMVGCWGITQKTVSKVKLTLDKYYASMKMTKNDSSFVDSIKINDQTIFKICEDIEMTCDDSYLPLYNHIIACESIELHKLEQIIKLNNGIPLERNTDAILYYGNKFDITNYYYDEKQLVKKYHYEENPSELKVNSVCKFIRMEKYKYNDKLWHNFEEIDNFENLSENIILNNKSILINGQAGCGKTYLLKQIIDKLEKLNKKIIKLAPTNKATRMIDGQTIHKFYISLALSKVGENKIIQNLKNIDYIIVDEISMVHEIFYRMFVLIKKYCPNIKFIICGDYKQLKPVNDRYNGNYKDSLPLFDLCDGQRLTLNKCRRSDKKLFELYQQENIKKIHKNNFKMTKYLSISSSILKLVD